MLGGHGRRVVGATFNVHKNVGVNVHRNVGVIWVLAPCEAVVTRAANGAYSALALLPALLPDTCHENVASDIPLGP
jgi:hypothetical protein